MCALLSIYDSDNYWWRAHTELCCTRFDEYFNITASVQKVFKMKGPKPRGSVSFLVCDLPNKMLKNDRPRRNISLLILVRVVKNFGLVVDGRGYLEKKQRLSRVKGHTCVIYADFYN